MSNAFVVILEKNLLNFFLLSLYLLSFEKEFRGKHLYSKKGSKQGLAHLSLIARRKNVRKKPVILMKTSYKACRIVPVTRCRNLLFHDLHFSPASLKIS